ncbi:MAG: AAA family ATPase [Kofleriaceae bacterium]|nr:AAA family ATPase [Kofleriaceae bacterium]
MGANDGTSAVREFAANLDTLVRARYPLVYLVSWEEQRVDGILADLASRHGKQLLEWSATRGLRRIAGARTASTIENVVKPVETLNAIAKLSEPSLVVLKDFHAVLEEPLVVRAMRELVHALHDTYSTVIVVSPVLKIPVELEKEVTVLDVPLPDFGELFALLKSIVAVVKKHGRVTINLEHGDVEALVRAALGLTSSEAENAFARAIAIDDRLDADDIKLVLEEKRQVIRKSGLLEYYPTEHGLGAVGGLEELKRWLDRRSAAFTDEARKFGLPEPKGLLLLGVQGCGKSLTAKAIASQWRLPLLRLDMGRIFGSLVGSSEENIRRAIRMAEGVAPIVLWIDEIEKGLSGVKSSGDTDGGTGARVFGALLTWMQEKTAPVFVVATANSIEHLPPELLRKGRFDEIFFIDLPSAKERAEIFEIHLRRRERDPARFDLAALASTARGFSGAEIEQAIISALYQAFDERTDITQAHIERAITETRPLSMTMAEDVTRLRTWAQSRARLASHNMDD